MNKCYVCKRISEGYFCSVECRDIYYPGNQVKIGHNYSKSELLQAMKKLKSEWFRPEPGQMKLVKDAQS
jgi:hypothetical protein